MDFRGQTVDIYLSDGWSFFFFDSKQKHLYNYEVQLYNCKTHIKKELVIEYEY